MNENLPLDMVTLVDDEGVERDFKVLDFIGNSKGRFYALVPNFSLPDKNSSEEELYFIFEIVEENGEEKLVEVDDNKLLAELSLEFEKRLKNI